MEDKLLKKLTFRYAKSFLYNAVASSSFISNKLGIYNKAISYDSIKGEELIKISDNLGLLFIAKNINNHFLIAENTGVTLIEEGYKYKGLSLNDGFLHRNWVKISLRKKIIDLDGQVINLIGIHKGCKHFFHFFFDYIIPLIFFLRFSDYKNQISILVRQNYNSFQKETYDMLESVFPNIKFIFVEKNHFFRVKNIIYLQHVHNAFYDYQRNKDLASIIRFLRDSFITKYQIKEKPYSQKDLIYIARKAKLRKVINSKQLEKYLINKGFKIKFFEKLPLKEQIETFYNAKFLFAIHGAALTNLIFASDNSSFMEIFPKDFRGNDFYRISKILNLKRFEYTENNEYLWQSLKVDIEGLDKELNLAFDNCLN